MNATNYRQDTMQTTIERIEAIAPVPKDAYTLVLIDSGVDDYEMLLQGILPDARGIVLNRELDGIEQISAILGSQNVDSLQIIAHGSPGSLQLGNTVLNAENIHKYRQQLQQWQVRDILIYGCEVAATAQGKSFISQIQQLTGANIAASEQKVGSSQQGGTWELTIQQGEISSTLALESAVTQAYPALLADDVTYAWAKNLGGSSSDQGYGIAVDSGGNVYTTGYFVETADFDPGAGTANLTSAGSQDIFISKLNSDGSFAWAKKLGGSSLDQGQGIAVDSGGNVYTTGYFFGTADFDPGAGTANLTSAGINDIFISKLNSDGTFAWAKKFGGSSNDIGYGIALDSGGNVYTTGYFYGTVDFDPGAGTANLTSAGNNDIFISKLNSDGTFAWAKNLGGSSDDIGNSIAVDSGGNVYTTGYFFGTADFDPGAGTANLTSAGSQDIFISKLNSDGTFAWAKNLGGSSTDIGNSIAVDSGGNVYTTGIFQGTADFDPGADTANLTSAGSYDIFISKLNSDGSFAWAKNLGGSSTDIGNSIAVDSGGNVYTTGFFSWIVDFDPGAGTANLTSAGSQDIFISKLNSDGTFAWAKNLGGSSFEQGNSIVVDSGGNVYTTGFFYGTADFDPGAGTANLTSAGSDDIFISKLSPTNSSPTNLTLSATTVNENVAANTVIGSFTTTDPDAGNTFTYSLVAGTGADDNSAFTINGNQLQINASPDFETKSSYNVRVRTTDSGGLTFDKALTIGINDVNEAPTDLTLSATTVNENVAANTVVGTFTTTDPDAGNTFTYSLVAGTGADDNSAFTINDNQLQINASPDFETKSSYNVRVQTTDSGGFTVDKELIISGGLTVDKALIIFGGLTFDKALTIGINDVNAYSFSVRIKDSGGLTFDKALTIGINDVNEAPTNLTLSATTVNENVAANTVIGTFTTTDPDAGNTFTYSLVAGTGATDNSAFTINGNQLQINASPDFETKSSYNVRVQTADQGGLIFEKELTININDVNELNGSNTRDPLTGSAGNDYITGSVGAKTLTGGAGNDYFIYNSLRDVGHTITDFTVGSDKLVFTQLLDSLVTGGYNGTNAIADGYVKIVQGSTANSAVVQIDRDGISGSAVFRNFITLDNITSTQLDNVTNFVF
ncbi:MAG: DUF4347 domain-containing protein [Gloeotrichia echinulata CP02]